MILFLWILKKVERRDKEQILMKKVLRDKKLVKAQNNMKNQEIMKLNQPDEKEKELSQEDLQQMMMVVRVEEVYVEALQVKYPIIDWEVYSEDTRRYWRIIKVGNHTKAYQIYPDMLMKFDREDLVKLWDLVKKRFSTTKPTDDKEKELWVELKRLFEPDIGDELWKLQEYIHDPLTWRLYDTCGVHHVSSDKGIDIFMLSTVKDLQAQALKQEEASTTWTKSSTNMTWNLGSRMIAVEISQTALKHEVSSLSVTLTLAITNTPANVEGENATNTATEEPPSHTEGETKEPKLAILISLNPSTEAPPTKAQPFTSIISHPESSQATRRIGKGKEIATESVEDPSKKLIQEYWDKEEKIKKAAEEARLLAMSKPEAREKFKKAQDAEHQVLKREHSKKIKRMTELNKKSVEQYMWTMTNRIKPETITDVKIYLNTKPVVLSIYRNNDKRNFEVHEPFKFADSGITELDELGPIIQKKKNSIIKDLMTSLSKRYERLKKIPKELGIQHALPAPVREQASSQTLGRKRKHIELEPEIKNMVIEEPEYGIFFTDVFGDQAFQRWSDIDKVGMEALVSYLVAASMVKSPENARFSMKLRKLIAEHPNQEKLKSKKVKLEALGYKIY
ncbi:hypothetical protein Tco_1108176 [Tanacetum coccineum]